MPLPIHQIRQHLLAASTPGAQLILSAPTGSGKSTQTPQFLLDDGNLAGRILVLQPRRLAARMLAARVADERDCRLGGEVGYLTRFEKAYQPASTRILFITEGILPRFLQNDPDLTDTDAVVFDEFHERSLTNDLGLGLVRRLQQARRPDLRLLTMSATLQVEALTAYLPEAKLLEVDVRQHPIDIQYQPSRAGEPVWDAAARALRGLLAREAAGDVLVFMPGSYEIRRTLDAIKALHTGRKLVVLPLLGNLPDARQRAVMEPVEGTKIVVATNIAETSLTIDGVRHVIDSGLARISRYAPDRELNTLDLEGISTFSADQRAGRAGRQGPGSCIRLWGKHQQDHRPRATEPEVHRVDLAETVLLLNRFGFPDPRLFPWLEPPSPERLDTAEQLLVRLGAIDRPGGRLTEVGQALTRFPMHPRLARLLQEAARRGALEEALTIAALLSEAPIYRTTDDGFRRLAERFSRPGKASEPASDFIPLADALAFAETCRFASRPCTEAGILPNPARQAARTRDLFRDICRRNGLPERELDDEHESTWEAAIRALVVAFPEHLAHRHDQGTLLCDLAGDRKGELVRASTCRHADVLIAGEIRQVSGTGRSARTLLYLASELRLEWLIDDFPEAWRTTRTSVWNEQKKVVETERVTSCLRVVIQREQLTDIDRNAAAEILADLVLKGKLPLKGWDQEVEDWMERVRWLAEHFPERNLPSYDDEDRALLVREICDGERAYSSIRGKPCLPYVQNALSWADQEFVRRAAPDRIMLPCGRRMRIRYVAGQPPVGKARIQDLYDLEETPVVAEGRARLLLEIQAPNMRAEQITDDLARFWRELYPEIKPRLSRRYPKHEWR